jgi:hypothetical protein
MHHILTATMQHEFQHANFGDQRLTKRLRHFAAALLSHPGAAIPNVTGSWGQACAAYRFLDNDRVTPAAILAPHCDRTRQRAATKPVALAVSDTCVLNYGERPATTGLGPIGTHAHNPRGLYLHGLLAFSPDREPLGLLHAQCWARDPAARRRGGHRNRRPVAAKESAKWLRSYTALCAHAAQTPATRWVFVADREADLYELFAAALAAPTQPAVLVRLQHDRAVAQSAARLFAHLARAPVAGQLEVAVPRRAGQAARTATVRLRYRPVCLAAPALKAAQPTLTLWAVEAREEQPPPGVAPLHWRLLTSLPVRSGADAVERVQWYSVRWGIEVLHKVLKSGCGVEAAQLASAARLQRYVMVQLVVAWQVMALAHGARARPTALVTEILAETEWRVLRAVVPGAASAPAVAPTLGEALRWVGQLGGHLGRRGDGPPGPLRLARGLHRLRDLTVGWEQAQVAKGCA